MRKKITISLFPLLLILSQQINGQVLPHLGWFDEGMLFYNPSYAGLGDEIRGTVIHRSQWKGISGSPLTYFKAVDAPLGKKMAVGGTISHDRIAYTTDNKITLDGSYRTYLNAKTFIQSGIKLSISSINSNFSDLSTWDDNDPLQNDITTIVPRLGFGFTLKSPKYYIGISLPDFFSYDSQGVLAEDSRFKYLRRNYFFNAGTKLPVTEYVNFIPKIIVRYYEGRSVNLTLNLGVELNQTINIGVSYVHPQIFGAYGKIAVSPRLKVGYRHEFSPSVISVGTFGTGEFIVTYGFQ